MFPQIHSAIMGSGSNLANLFTFDQEVVIAGIRPSEYSGTYGNIQGDANGRTAIIRTRCARQNELIRKIDFYVKNPGTGGNPNNWKFVVHREDGSGNYVRVFEEALSTVTTGLNTKTISGSFKLQHGDLVGFYVPTTANWGAITYTGANNTFSDASGDSTSFVLTGTYAQIGTITVYGREPLIAESGDSIGAGTSNGTEGYYPFFEQNDPTPKYVPGNRSARESQPMYRVSQFDPSITFQNLCLGGQTLSWVETTALPILIETKPKILSLHVGVNDIDASTSWATMEASLDAIRAGLPTAIIFLDEILPTSNFTDAKAANIRTINGNYATWAAANSAYLVECHDAFGQLRVSTGELDDLSDDYNVGDGTHLNLAGVNKLAELKFNKMITTLI